MHFYDGQINTETVKQTIPPLEKIIMEVLNTTHASSLSIKHILTWLNQALGQCQPLAYLQDAGQKLHGGSTKVYQIPSLS